MKDRKQIGPKGLQRILGLDARGIDDLVARAPDCYHSWTKPKRNPDGTPRIVNGQVQRRHLTSAREPLRSAQRRILNHILRPVNLPEYVQGYVPGRSNVTNAGLHVGYKYHLKFDIRNFFPSITHRRVYEVFVRLGCIPDVAAVLTRLTTFQGSLPQGTSTSAHLANLAVADLDSALYAFACERGFMYTRYGDDVTISGNTDFRAEVGDVLQIVKDFGFGIAHRKTEYVVGTTSVTGAVVGRNGLRLPSDKRERLHNLDPDTPQYKGLKGYDRYVRSAS